MASPLIGSKLGAKLAQAAADATIATRRGLMDTEHQLRVGSAWTVITQMGTESAGFLSLIRKGLASNPNLPSDLNDWAEENLSGKNQWQAILSGLGWSAIGGQGVGSIISNYLQPFVRTMLSVNPEMEPEAATIAQMWARNVGTGTDYIHDIQNQGFDADWARRLMELAQTIPDSGTLLAMLWRRIIDGATFQYWAGRAGIPPEIVDKVVGASIPRLAPEQAADLANKGLGQAYDAVREAADSGVEGTRFAAMQALALSWLPLDTVLRLARRGVITDAQRDSYATYLGLAPEHVALLGESDVIPPSPPEIIQALVQSQTDKATAFTRYVQAGGDPTWFDTDYNTTGEAPGPAELATMANRGIIPWTGTGPGVLSFQQGIAEGRSRTKWTDAYQKAAVYYPPPRTITALYHSGAITKAEAITLLRQQGVPVNLAAAYTLDTAKAKTAKQRDLTIGQIETLYEEKALTTAEATTALMKLGYDSHDAALVLAVAETKRAMAERNRVISVVRHAFLTGVTDAQTAQQDLVALQLPMAQVADLINSWTVEKPLTRKRLTVAEVKSAHKHGILSDNDTAGYYASLGYDDADVAILMQLP
jgi:hypothetical protein